MVSPGRENGFAEDVVVQCGGGGGEGAGGADGAKRPLHPDLVLTRKCCPSFEPPPTVTDDHHDVVDFRVSSPPRPHILWQVGICIDVCVHVERLGGQEHTPNVEHPRKLCH